MNAIILSIGDELVLGQTIDTNSAWISQQLAAVGCGIVGHATVPDDQKLIEDAIRSAINRELRVWSQRTNAPEIDKRQVAERKIKLLEEAGEEYILSLFPHGVPKISLEAGATMGWWKYIGRDGIAIGLDRFGASAPAPLVQDKLGISAAHVVEAAKKLLKK